MTRARCLHADHVFVGEGAAIADGAVVVDDDGVVVDVGPAGEVVPRHAGAAYERQKGLLIPGLINAHTHLELSHLRGRLPGGSGFVVWAKAMLAVRAADEGEVAEAVGRAVADLDAAGTVAVGEVSNSLAAVSALLRSGLAGTVFHEVFGFDRGRAEARARSLAAERDEVVGPWPDGELGYLPAPHTLYTLHPDVARGLGRRAAESGRRTSLHLAEHAAEREFLERGAGPVVEFARHVGASLEGFPVPNQGPIDSAAGLGLLGPHVLLVHLTDARSGELARVAEARSPVVFCPRSNLFIELRLPPLPAALAAGLRPGLGTDSLASNTSLDVLAEARSLAERFPGVPAETLFAMATGWGADALGVSGLGYVKKGARPGVVRVEGEAPAGDALRFYLTRPVSARHWAVRRAAGVRS